MLRCLLLLGSGSGGASACSATKSPTVLSPPCSSLEYPMVLTTRMAARGAFRTGLEGVGVPAQAIAWNYRLIQTNSRNILYFLVISPYSAPNCLRPTSALLLYLS